MGLSKLFRAGATVAKEARTPAAKRRVKKRVDLEKIVRDGDPDSKAVKEAQAELDAMDAKEAAENNARRARAGGSKDKDKVDLPKLKSEKDMNKGGAVKKPTMMRGGMANGKAHMYAAGGNVTDKLPNKGLKKLAKTEKGKTAVRKMGFDV